MLTRAMYVGSLSGRKKGKGDGVGLGSEPIFFLNHKVTRPGHSYFYTDRERECSIN